MSKAKFEKVIYLGVDDGCVVTQKDLDQYASDGSYEDGDEIAVYKLDKVKKLKLGKYELV